LNAEVASVGVETDRPGRRIERWRAMMGDKGAARERRSDKTLSIFAILGGMTVGASLLAAGMMAARLFWT